MRRRPYRHRRRGQVYDWNRISLASILALLALYDVWLLAHLDRLSSVLPAALRQPLVAVVLVGVAMLPAFALRVAETALRPRLQLMLPAIRSGVPAANHPPRPYRSSASRASR